MLDLATGHHIGESSHGRGAAIRSGAAHSRAHATETRTGTTDQEAAPEVPALERIWEAEWRGHLVQTALERLRTQVPPAQYEIYHLHVIDGMSASETARALEVSVASVYLAKLRVGRRLREEIRRLGAEKSEPQIGTIQPSWRGHASKKWT